MSKIKNGVLDQYAKV